MPYFLLLEIRVICLVGVPHLVLRAADVPFCPTLTQNIQVHQALTEI